MAYGADVDSTGSEGIALTAMDRYFVTHWWELLAPHLVLHHEEGQPPRTTGSSVSGASSSMAQGSGHGNAGSGVGKAVQQQPAIDLNDSFEDVEALTQIVALPPVSGGAAGLEVEQDDQGGPIETVTENEQLAKINEGTDANNDGKEGMDENNDGKEDMEVEEMRRAMIKAC